MFSVRRNEKEKLDASDLHRNCCFHGPSIKPKRLCNGRLDFLRRREFWSKCRMLPRFGTRCLSAGISGPITHIKFSSFRQICLPTPLLANTNALPSCAIQAHGNDNRKNRMARTEENVRHRLKHLGNASLDLLVLQSIEVHVPSFTTRKLTSCKRQTAPSTVSGMAPIHSLSPTEMP